MDRWDLILIVFAGYIAVTSLVRLMAARRNELVEQVRAQIEAQRKAGRAAAKREEAA